MPYRSMAYKILETDSKSGSESGLPFDRCHILNDNALSKRRYIHKEKAGLSTSYPQLNRSVANLQHLAKLTTSYPQVIREGLADCG